MQNSVGFYGEQTSTEFKGVPYTSEALIDAEKTVAERRIFKRAVVRERDEMTPKKEIAKATNHVGA